MFNRYRLTIPAIFFVAAIVLGGCENYAERTHESWIEAPKGLEFDDSTIYARIAYTVNTDPDLQGGDVEIKVDDGKVFLTGTVTNKNHITRINMITWMVDGVKDVDNQLTVR